MTSEDNSLPFGKSAIVRSAALGLAALWLCGLATPVAAQRFLPDERPGDIPPALPPFEAPEGLEPVPVLPPYPVPEAREGDAFPTGRPVEVRKIEIEGNTVVPSEVLAEIAHPYEGRTLTFSQLQSLRDRLTLAYVERGFATSGATLPDQALEDGVLRVKIVEGSLGQIDVKIDGRFQPDYFRKRIAHSNRGVLNVQKLQEQLELFQQNPQIVSLKAKLEPTSTRGISLLDLEVDEAPFYDLYASFDNYRSPAIGSLGGTAQLQLYNLYGEGDALWARFSGSEGLRQAEVRVEYPVTVWDTQLGARYQYSLGKVVDDNFEVLGLKSEAQSIAFEVRQPLYRTLQTQISGQVSAGWRKAQSFLFDGEIGLPTLYSEDGKSQIAVLRFGLDAFYRTRSQSVAFRSLVSKGVDVLGATVNPSGIPDGEFVAWLGQFQWASRLPWFGIQTLLRGDAQLTPDPLLPLEQFAIGGRYTVRGYRENILVRDNGFAASFEVRVPVFEWFDPAVRIELAPFADIGRSWNNKRSRTLNQTRPELIGSVGIGVRILLTRFGFGELYWGHPLKKVRTLAESDLQDDGIHFRLSVNWP